MIIVGLGNPGEEYACTRHNVGRIVVESLASYLQAGSFEFDKSVYGRVARGFSGKHEIVFLLPETFMNLSGKSVVAQMKKRAGKVDDLVVIYDDIDLPLGSIKISFNRSSGGHNGVESVINSVQSSAFIRIRVGIAPRTPDGSIKKPTGDEKVLKWVLGTMKKDEQEMIQVVSNRVLGAINTILEQGLPKAMSLYNTK